VEEQQRMAAAVSTGASSLLVVSSAHPGDFAPSFPTHPHTPSRADRLHRWRQWRRPAQPVWSIQEGEEATTGTDPSVNPQSFPASLSPPSLFLFLSWGSLSWCSTVRWTQRVASRRHRGRRTGEKMCEGGSNTPVLHYM
jgi:hypothetical protein